MKTTTRGKVGIASVLALGIALIGAPAIAAEGDPVPEFTVANTTYAAGSWGDGVAFEVTIPDAVEFDVTGVQLSVGSMGENGGGLVGSADAVEGEGGVWTGTVQPDVPPIAPDADGFPVYTASAAYTYELEGETQYVYGEAIELEIVDGASVTGPAEATVSELAAGVPLAFEGFVPDETLTGDISYFDPETGDFESIGEFSATVGADGSGEGTLTITGAAEGNQFRVTANGENSSVQHWITATADEGGEDGGDDNTGDEDGNGGDGGSQGPKKPERVETNA